MGLSFPEGYLSEDSLFLQNLIPRINKVLVTGIPLYYYRQRSGSITKSFNPIYKKTYIKMNTFKEFISKYYPACSKSFIVFQDTFLCHILLLLQTYHCDDRRTVEYLNREFNKRFIVIIRNELISKRVKIQSVFLRLGLGGLFSWLKMLYQRRF